MVLMCNIFLRLLRAWMVWLKGQIKLWHPWTWKRYFIYIFLKHMVTQGSKVPFSKSHLLATFICKMVAIDNYLVAKKKIVISVGVHFMLCHCKCDNSTNHQQIFQIFFKSVSCQLATFTAVLGNKYIFSRHGDQTGPNLEGYPRDFHASYSTLLLKCNISV